MHICCNRKLNIIPVGPVAPGFARGWLKLPVELKLAILRYNLTFSVAIWPSNVNAVIRNHLLPYLRMTPEIASLAKAVFYQENQFIVQFSSSMPGSNTAMVKPPILVRSQLRRIKFLTRLTVLDWQMLRMIAEEGGKAGFTSLVHLQVRYLLKEAAAEHKRFRHGNKRDDTEILEDYYHDLHGPQIRFSLDGEVLYDVSGYDSTGNWEEDVAILTWMQTMRDLVSRHITFNNK